MNDETQIKQKDELEEQLKGRRDLVKALFLCLLAVIGVRSFLFEPFKIPSSSMLPTLKIGDHIFVSKFNFGLSVPFTKMEFIRWGEPKRGDVIVFLFPKDESLHYIKRVIGVPGDKIEFRGRELYINDQLVQKNLVSDPILIEMLTGIKDLSRFEIYKETIDSVTHYVQYKVGNDYDLSRTNLTQVVPADSFFVSGDNRDDSYDSRSWGFVSRENIKGKAQTIWLSLNPDSPWGTLNKIRWSRCGTLIK